MIDIEFVGALVTGDVSGYQLQASDIKTISTQRVITDVSRALRRGPDDGVTVEAAAMLSEARVRATLRSMQQARAANDAAQILAAAGIPALVYKGVALAVELHGDWRGRESSDVDILIAPDSVQAAHEVLLAGGLSRAGEDQSPPDWFHRFRAFEASYTGLPVTLDLHWHVESPGYFAVPFDEMWARRRRVAADKLNIWTPSSAETLLIAAVHGTRESWRSLRHILDFALAATQISPEDWQLAVHLSELGPRKSLAIALAVAQRCGVRALPAQPGPWAQQMAMIYLEPLQEALYAGDSSHTPRTRTPGAALKRRLLRWQTAPSTSVAAGGLIRSALRQVGYGGKRSWDPHLDL